MQTSTIEYIANILREYSLAESTFSPDHVPLLKRIRAQMLLGNKLTFILPAFPAKSPSREKTLNELPDFGEVLALQNLQTFCDRIAKLYTPGSEIIICSDGRVFSDVVNVDDARIDVYNQGVQTIFKEYELHDLRMFNMDDLYPELGPDELREFLLSKYAMSLEHVRDLVRTDFSYRALFNGIHRFLIEDLRAQHLDASRSSLEKIAKQNTYELLRRSDAWSSLLSDHFPSALRLSIHPHAIGHEKFGIKLVPSSDKWATPWHNVVVKINNRFELMHLRQAVELCATLKMERDKYAYFEVPAVG